MAKTQTTERKARKAPPKDESEAEKFSRLCSARLGNADKAIRLIGNCAGPGYKSTPEQQKKIVEVLDAARDFVIEMFKTGGAKSAKAGIKL